MTGMTSRVFLAQAADHSNVALGASVVVGRFQLRLNSPALFKVTGSPAPASIVSAGGRGGDVSGGQIVVLRSLREAPTSEVRSVGNC